MFAQLHTIYINSVILSLYVHQGIATGTLLNVLGLLYHHGANPMLKSKEGKTAKDVAVESKISIVAALLGNH